VGEKGEEVEYGEGMECGIAWSEGGRKGKKTRNKLLLRSCQFARNEQSTP